MLDSEYVIERLVLDEATPGAAVDSRAIAETVRAYAPDILHHIQTSPPGHQILVQVTTEGAWVGLSVASIRLPAPADPLLEFSFPAHADQTLEGLLGEIALWESEHAVPKR